MGTIGIVLLVFFIIVCVLLVLLVSIQSDNEDGMGGLLGGRGTAAFGSHSANVLTKATTVLVVLFFVLTLGLALVNKKPKTDSILNSISEEEILDESTVSTNWWEDSEQTEAVTEEAAE
ncbi:MAG: preprotein translocase subunit SecG [Treponema sp.]|nr:preprotein translocase subunit SecG [Treponema sp.]